MARLNQDLREAIHAGMNSGPAIAADDVFAKLDARYAEQEPASCARKPFVRGCAVNSGIQMSDDFDAPLDDSADYM